MHITKIKTNARFLFTVVLEAMLIADPIAYSQETDGLPPQTDSEKFVADLNYAIQDPVSRQDIYQTLAEEKTLLARFLGDMIAVMADFEAQDVFDPNLRPAEQFVQKWSTLPADCAYCDVFEPFFKSMLSEFTRNIAFNSSINPFARLHFAFNTWAYTNPFGLRAFFSIQPVADKKTTLVIHEKSRNVTRGKEGREVYVEERRIAKTVNGFPVFGEYIKDDQLQDFFILRTEVDSMTALLNALKEDDTVKPEAAALVSHYVQLIAMQLKAASENGDLDDYTYSYLTESQAQNRDLIPSKHPLLKPPFHTDYEVLKYYQGSRS